MKKLILFFIIFFLSLNWAAADSSKKIEDLELELDYLAAGFNYEQTIDAADELLKYEPKHAKALFRKAIALTELGKYPEALVLFNLAIKYKYKNIEYLYYWMGECFEKFSKLEEALNAYELSIEKGYGWISVYNGRDRVLMKLGRLGINAQKIIDSEDEFLGSVLGSEWDKTVAATDELLKYDVHHPVIYYERAKALSQLRRYQEASIMFELALKHKYPYLGELYYYRGNCLEQLNKLKEALKSYNLSMKYGNDASWVYFARYGVLNKLGRLDKELE